MAVDRIGQEKALSLAAAVAQRSDYCQKPYGRAAAAAREGAGISKLASNSTLSLVHKRHGEWELGQALALAQALGFAKATLDVPAEVSYERTRRDWK